MSKIIFLTSCVEYVPSTYGEYKYPSWARGLGWATVALIMSPMLFLQLRNQTGPIIEEWKSQGFNLSTTSNEACKMYDATLAQMVSSYDDPSIGGFEGTVTKMFEADPKFVAGIALKLGLAGQFDGKRTYNDPDIAKAAKQMMDLAEKPHLTTWEKNHAQAINLYLNGQRQQAADVLEDVLIDHPLDMGAIKFACGMYVENGFYPLLWACFSALEGDHAFLWALQINPNDAWAVHCIAHVREMNGQFQQGSDFMKETEKDWNESMLDCHNYWHWALFKYEAGDFETARGILDTQVLPLMRKYKSPFSVTDASSLMYRLEAEGYPVEGWNDVVDVSLSHMEDYAWSYSDINVMLACAGSKQKMERDKIVENIKDVISAGDKGDNVQVYKEATLPVLEAIQAYDDGDYDRAVECLKPVRYELYKIGGSNAQRDLFNVILIQSAFRSKNYQKYANHLIAERQSMKGETPLMQKMLQQLVVEH